MTRQLPSEKLEQPILANNVVDVDTDVRWRWRWLTQELKIDVQELRLRALTGWRGVTCDAWRVTRDVWRNDVLVVVTVLDWKWGTWKLINQSVSLNGRLSFTIIYHHIILSQSNSETTNRSIAHSILRPMHQYIDQFVIIHNNQSINLSI